MGGLGLIVFIIGIIGIAFWGWPVDAVAFALICAIAIEAGTGSN